MALAFPISGTHKGIPYYAFFPYYPKRYEVDDDLDYYRYIIYRFKDGQHSGGISWILAQFLEEILAKEHSIDGSWWLCIVPSSTKEKTQSRFQSFCDRFCSLTNLNDGYDLIYNTVDRSPKHITNEQVDIFDYIKIGNVKNKDILLFDDVFTSGKSFKRIAKKLKKKGASSVVGMFLAKTCHVNPFARKEIKYCTLHLYGKVKINDIDQGEAYFMPEEEEQEEKKKGPAYLDSQYTGWDDLDDLPF